jgi:hypothetical protein
MIAIGLKLLPLLIATAGGWIGYKFVKRGVRERIIGSIVGGIVTLSVYIIIKLMDKYLF